MKTRQFNEFFVNGRLVELKVVMKRVIALVVIVIVIVSARVIPDPTKELVPFSLIWEKSKDSKLNLSFLLEKPAGEDGFIKVNGAHFVKPSGERFKMWGVNFTGGACFPEKKDASLIADYLARFGINSVRFHYMDAAITQVYSNWKPDQSLIDYSQNTTRKLFPEQLDKLDFLISELKKVGIYSDINLNVGRTFKKDDGIPDYELVGIKAVTLFDDHIIELQKEYAKQLLTHVNPYTGNAYINEPAIALVEIVNENSLVDAWFYGRLQGKRITPTNDTWVDISPYQSKELTKKYNKWLKDNTSASELQLIEKEAGVKAGEEVPRLSPKEFKEASVLRFHTEAKFIMHTERSFYIGMYNYLKNELGVKCPIIASSDHNHSMNCYSLLSMTSLLDVIDAHEYWQHPFSGVDKESGKQVLMIENTPMVNRPELSTVGQVARSAVEGKPFIISELNHPFPNVYACEGIPIFTAYALLQDWDGIFFYTFEHVPADKWNSNYAIANTGAFDMGLDPVKMAGVAANGLIFIRNDLRPAESCVFRGYSEKNIIDGIREKFGDNSFFTKGFSPLIPLIEKTRINSFNKEITDFPEIKNTMEINSKTGEIRWHKSDRSYVEISSPKTESLIGFMPEATSLLKHLKIKIKNDFAAISIVSVDNKPLATSEKILLITTGQTGMSGMKFSDDRRRLVVPGAKPTTIEVITGEIVLSGLTNAKKVIMEPLDGSGNPLKSKTLSVNGGSTKINIGKDVTVWYYLQVVR